MFSHSLLSQSLLFKSEKSLFCFCSSFNLSNFCTVLSSHHFESKHYAPSIFRRKRKPKTELKTHWQTEVKVTVLQSQTPEFFFKPTQTWFQSWSKLRLPQKITFTYSKGQPFHSIKLLPSFLTSTRCSEASFHHRTSADFWCWGACC